MLATPFVRAQTEVQCGSIIEGEFTLAYQDGEQTYTIPLAPGDVLGVSGEVVGDFLGFGIAVYAPTTGRVAATHLFAPVRGSAAFGVRSAYPEVPSIDTGALSERGTYTILLHPNSPGLYTLYIGCTLRDGTVINPGDTPSGEQPVEEPIVLSVEMPANFIGFPGLAPVDFASVARIPMIAATPMTGAITPTGGEILGYTLDANTDDVLDLTFTRLSGNLNLGLVVLSADNQVVFQASLVTSQTLSTRFTLPSDGQYTIGVFRIDLLPPAAPEPTAFQLQATLNP
jgi:hypothetical protein